ncbi:MAG: PEP-CTERM sorting domain-containing protein [Thiobacillus sp.]|nr:PEP-CTERM sorting domain-containing protein [Thiobacillus sp.]
MKKWGLLNLSTMLLGLLTIAYQPLALATASTSTTLGFYSITNSNTGAVTDGEANLSVEVIDAGGNQVQFKFTNNSTSSLADVYFDDGTLLGIASITDSGSGVAFSQFASPGNLPAANNASPAFMTTAGFSADSDPAVSPNGVSQGEWLTITFNLVGGKTYADTIAALTLPNGGGAGDLRIGVHVQSFASGGGSESFVNTPVPEAETYAMMLAGLGLVGFMGAVRKRSLLAAV